MSRNRQARVPRAGTAGRSGRAEQVLDILDGKRPPRLINPEVWPAYVKRFERVLGFKPVE